MLPLAVRLRSAAPDELTDGLRRRAFETTGIHDVFDLAEALLRDESIDAALSHLSRRRLAVLAAAGGLSGEGGTPTIAAVAEAAGVSPADASVIVDALQAVFLLNSDGDTVQAFPEVSARLALWPSIGLPDARELAAPLPPRLVVDPPDENPSRVDAFAAERAFATVRSLADLIPALAHEPVRQLGRGGLALPDARRVAETTGTDVADAPVILGIAASAGLVQLEGSEWMPTPTGEAWIGLDAVGRWRALAESWRAGLPSELLDVLAARLELSWGAGLREDVHWFYPAGAPWLDARIDEVSRVGESIGLTTTDGLSSLGRDVLAGDVDAAAATLQGLVPRHVDKVYLQHDLTIVSPGPLDPAIDTRLRTMADVEGRELASSYRISTASLNRALTGGETADSIRTFLAAISLTGLPQPLAYLIDESASRYGRVRVGALPAIELPLRSYVRSDDAHLIGTIAVDRSLAAIALTRSGDHRLVSRFAPDIVHWALSDARYPVAAEDDHGVIVRMRRQRVARVAANPAPPRDVIAEIVERVRSSGDGDLATDQAWMARQLEMAARAKVAVTVSVRMPDGGTSDYLLEPTSVANGRVRARDRRADIERTLPLSAIAGIRENAD